MPKTVVTKQVLANIRANLLTLCDAMMARDIVEVEGSLVWTQAGGLEAPTIHQGRVWGIDKVPNETYFYDISLNAHAGAHRVIHANLSEPQAVLVLDEKVIEWHNL